MAHPPGRDQDEPMERLIRMLILLSDHGARGVSARQLAACAGYTDDTGSSAAALRRELERLKAGGWTIDNVAAVGDSARYVLRPQDNRMALLLTAGERVALQRAADDSDAEVTLPPFVIADLERAVELHCLTHFTYKGSRRSVHPYALRSGPSGWMLRGRETQSQLIKEFAVTRMGDDVQIDQPGTAEGSIAAEEHASDPMDWPTDPAVEVTLLTTDDYLTEVQRVLSGGRVTSRDAEGVRLSLTVTNRAAFRSRLYELGIRVWVLGPPEVRAEILADLHAVADASV